MKITVVTIVYNLIDNGRKDMFRQCVESVHNQKYKDIEHIVIDGASKDGTLDLLKEYQKKGWIKYYSEPDTGIYDAMNKGLKKATGDYITFLNSDDFYYDDKGIQSVVKTLTKNNVDSCFGTCQYITLSGEKYCDSMPVLGSFFVAMPFSHQTLFVKTKVMRKLKGFDTKFKSAGDFDFIIRLFMSGATVAENNYSFVNYRIGGMSETQKDLSNKECIKSFIKNYKPLYPALNAKKMFFERFVSGTLFNKIKSKVCDYVKQCMQRVWDNADDMGKNVKHINDVHYVIMAQKTEDVQTNETQENTEQTVTPSLPKSNILKEYYYLFDVIPFIKTKSCYGVKRWFLFGCLPIFKTKHNDKKVQTYLLCFIPLTYKSTQYGGYKLRIFGIPIVRIKHK